MKSRRNFLVHGSMAAAAMLVLKPFETVAGTGSPFSGFGAGSNNLIFFHTAQAEAVSTPSAIRCLKKIKNNNSAAVLMHAGNDLSGQTGQLAYDVSIDDSGASSSIKGDYKIMYKGDIKMGIISARPGDENVVEKIKTLSAFLKNEKNCQVVVCLSQLGFENKNGADDRALARKTAHLDIIIGGHVKNFSQFPRVVLNSNDNEVIIHSAAGNSLAYGLIDIDFDKKGQRKFVRFTERTA